MDQLRAAASFFLGEPKNSISFEEVELNRRAKNNEALRLSYAISLDIHNSNPDYFEKILEEAKQKGYLNKQGGPSKAGSILHHMSISAYYDKDDKDYKLVKLLLKNGADINIQDNNGNTVLHCIIHQMYLYLFVYFNKYSEIIKFMIEKGADLSIENKYGDTPLNEMLKLEEKAWISQDEINPVDYMIKSLFEKTKDYKFLRHKNKEGNTPLHIAAAFGQMGTVTSLLERGAKIDAINNQGLTPLFYAIMNTYNHPEENKLIDIFLKKADELDITQTLLNITTKSLGKGKINYHLLDIVLLLKLNVLNKQIQHEDDPIPNPFFKMYLMLQRKGATHSDIFSNKNFKQEKQLSQFPGLTFSGHGPNPKWPIPPVKNFIESFDHKTYEKELAEQEKEEQAWLERKEKSNTGFNGLMKKIF